ncbi:MAG: hypothetical protein GX592_03005 [Clostridiales bacterium]|nr:hypothetical protein [Clostridiales bacterium]
MGYEVLPEATDAMHSTTPSESGGGALSDVPEATDAMYFTTPRLKMQYPKEFLPEAETAAGVFASYNCGKFRQRFLNFTLPILPVYGIVK